MTRRRSIVPLAAAALLLSGCSVGPEESGRPATGQTLDVSAFADRVEQDGTIVLDVRTPQEYAGGHLPDAVNIDLAADDFAERIEELEPEATYAVYCRTGSRSAEAMETMLDGGFVDVAHLEGGITAWESAGRDVVSTR